jgi:acetyl-CoA/propionyl-CoA carboxylase biotin carboxyl carrier protein
VRAGRLDTGLIERDLDALRAPDPVPDAAVVAVLWSLGAGAVGGGPTAGRAAARAAGGAGGPEAAEADRTAAPDAWRLDGWRLGDHRPTVRVVVDRDGRRTEVAVLGPPHDARVGVDGGPPVPARLVRTGAATAHVTVDGVGSAVHVTTDGTTTWVGRGGAVAELRVRSRLDDLVDARTATHRDSAAVDPQVRAPMPGTVVTVDVQSGEHVTAGQTLLTVEAMKMEHRLTATTDGVVTLTARPADRVALDQVLATITPHGTDHTGHDTTGQDTTAPAEEGTRP